MSAGVVLLCACSRESLAISELAYDKCDKYPEQITAGIIYHLVYLHMACMTCNNFIIDY